MRAPAFGFESTWRFASKRKQSKLDRLDEICQSNISKWALAQIEKLDLVRSPETDPYNIEIPSMQIDSDLQKLFWKQYSSLTEILGAEGLVPSSVGYQPDLEGGGHIHLDVMDRFFDGVKPAEVDMFSFETMFSRLWRAASTEQKTLYFNFTLHLITFLSNNPWIVWALNGPVDNYNGRNYQNKLENGWLEDVNQAMAKSLSDNGLRPLVSQNFFNKGACASFRLDKGTVEFRLFGMPKTVKAAKVHVEIAMAIYEHAYQLAKSGAAIGKIKFSESSLKRITHARSRAGFLKAMQIIGVSEKTLSYTAWKDNLAARYENEKWMKNYLKQLGNHSLDAWIALNKGLIMSMKLTETSEIRKLYYERMPHMQHSFTTFLN